MREQETSVPNRLLIRAGVTLLIIGVAAVSGYAPFARAGGNASPVATAAHANDVAQVRQLIKSGADVNAPAADGTTPLLYAAFDSNVDMLKTLLSAGADPNV